MHLHNWLVIRLELHFDSMHLIFKDKFIKVQQLQIIQNHWKYLLVKYCIFWYSVCQMKNIKCQMVQFLKFYDGINKFGVHSRMYCKWFIGSSVFSKIKLQNCSFWNFASHSKTWELKFFSHFQAHQNWFDVVTLGTPCESKFKGLDCSYKANTSSASKPRFKKECFLRLFIWCRPVWKTNKNSLQFRSKFLCGHCKWLNLSRTVWWGLVCLKWIISHLERELD